MDDIPLYKTFLTNDKSYKIGDKYHTVYIVVNLINDKFYIGKHSTTDLNDDYLGSGYILNKAIIKYGKDNFKKYYISFNDTEQEAYSKEKDLLTEDFINDYGNGKVSYNVAVGGRCLIMTDSIKDKISNSLSGNKHPFYGKKLTDEHKKNLSLANSGKIFGPLNEEVKIKISNATKEENNPRCILSLEDCNKIFNLLKDTNTSQKDIAKMFNINNTTLSQINLGKHWSCKHIDNYKKNIRFREKPIKRKLTKLEIYINKSKITLEKCNDIYKLLKDTNTDQQDIAMIFNISINTVSRINSGKHWSCEYINDYKLNVRKPNFRKPCAEETKRKISKSNLKTKNGKQ